MAASNRFVVAHFRCVNCSVDIVVTLCVQVMLTGIIAVSVPHFGEVIGLIGSLGSSLLAYILPPLFYVIIFGKDLTLLSKVGHLSLMTLGIVGGLVAAYLTYEVPET